MIISLHTIRAIQDYRFAPARKENRRKKRRAKDDGPGGLGEILDALAQGLAGLGLPPTKGRSHPPRPAH